MNHNAQPMDRCRGDGTCPHSGEAAAYLADELSALDRSVFDAHQTQCPACTRELEQVRRTMGILKTLQPADESRDLAPGILARLEQESAQLHRMSTFRILSMAAVFLLLVGGGLGFFAWRGTSPESGPSMIQHQLAARVEALDWLCRTQAPDGSWNTETWGGDKQFHIALSSLAVLALLGPEPVIARRETAVREAVRYLVAQQNATGEFGPSFDSAPYNHGIATLALLRALHVLHDESFKPSLDKALGVIRDRQLPEGGWGYWGDAGQEPNLSVTLWQVEALKLAVSLGWDEVRPHVRQGVLWVASVGNDRGGFGYRRADDSPVEPQTLTAMGATAVLNVPDQALEPSRRDMILTRVHEAALQSVGTRDYYLAYFLTTAMQKMQDPSSANQLAMIRHSLVRDQVLFGAEKGSWTPDARWGSVGGRVYSTALASMSLE